MIGGIEPRGAHIGIGSQVPRAVEGLAYAAPFPRGEPGAHEAGRELAERMAGHAPGRAQPELRQHFGDRKLALEAVALAGESSDLVTGSLDLPRMDSRLPRMGSRLLRIGSRLLRVASRLPRSLLFESQQV